MILEGKRIEWADRGLNGEFGWLNGEPRFVIWIIPSLVSAPEVRTGAAAQRALCSFTSRI